MKKRIFSLFFVSALAMGLLSCAYLQTQQRQLAEKLVRLHVVANSDSPSDQAIKLRVRDAVLAAAEPVLGSADDPEQALAAGATRAGVRGGGNAARAWGARNLSPSRCKTSDSQRAIMRRFRCPRASTGTLRVTIGAGEGAQLVVRRLPNALHCGKPR